ncbi:MAG TPA: hypothetical protein VI670_15915 [Thermoanaerobaculia bacterium]
MTHVGRAGVSTIIAVVTALTDRRRSPLGRRDWRASSGTPACMAAPTTNAVRLFDAERMFGGCM